MWTVWKTINFTVKSDQRQKGQYMKESNTLVDSAENNLVHNQIWPDTKGQYMKESNILVDSVENN